jgi:hypothetical protein
MDVGTVGFGTPIKDLPGTSLKLCQFALQSTKLQKAACDLTEVSADEFVTVKTTGKFIRFPKYRPNGLFGGAKALGDLVILQTTGHEEHRLELHRLQKICQRRRVDGAKRIGTYD